MYSDPKKYIQFTIFDTFSFLHIKCHLFLQFYLSNDIQRFYWTIVHDFKDGQGCLDLIIPVYTAVFIQ